MSDALSTTLLERINALSERVASLERQEFNTADPTVAHTHAVFVAKSGSDSNSGLKISVPKLTLSAAVTAASSLITAGATAVNIEVLDGGSYTESSTLTIPANVHLLAPAATFTGQISITASGSAILDKHYAAANNANMVQHAGGAAGPAIYQANICDGRGAGGTYTGVQNVRNFGGSGRNLFVRVGILFVSASGIGIGDVSSGDAGHIHILIPDLYLAGNNAIGILGSAVGAGASNIVGFIDHILETGTPSSTVGISVTNTNAIVKLVAAEIVADTAYSITAGSLYLVCPKITGTTSGTPIFTAAAAVHTHNVTDINDGSTAFTPQLKFGGNAVGMTGDFRGRYTKIGKMVAFVAYIELTAKGSSTGDARIDLPFTNNSSATGYYIADHRNMNANYVQVGIVPSFGNAYAQIRGATAAAASLSNLTDTAFTDTSVILTGGVFFTT